MLCRGAVLGTEEGAGAEEVGSEEALGFSVLQVNDRYGASTKGYAELWLTEVFFV